MESEAVKPPSQSPGNAVTLTSSNGNNSQGELILSKVPVRVQKVRFDGLVRTKDDILTKHVQPLFSAKNFEEMVKRAHTAKSQLEQLGLFKSVEIAIDVSRGARARPDGYSVTYVVKEQRPMTGSINTMIGTNEGNIVGGVQFPNFAGRGERIAANLSWGSKSAVGGSLSFSKPLQGDPKLIFQSGIFQNSVDMTWSGYKDLTRGIYTEIMFPSFLGSHSLRWEGSWRELSCLTPSTSFAVREQSGHSLKSLIRHTWERDTRDSRILPNTGTLLRTVHEVAGLGGDAQYFKQEAEFQVNRRLPLDSVLQFSFATGMVNGLFKQSKLGINDRLFLGGPLTLRGFNIQGVGPHDNDCALGADAYWVGGLHLYTPLPFRPGKGGFGDNFRTHFFVNAGNLTTINQNASWRDNLVNMAETMRLSYGAGIAMKLGGIARLEVNYCVPIRSQSGDSINPGLQFGVGIKFL